MARPQVDLRQLGVSGLVRYGGLIRDEWMPQLQGRRGAKTYREMRDNHAIIGAGFRVIEMFMRQATYRVNENQDDPVESRERNANHIDESLGDMASSWTDKVGEILGFLELGWQLHEIGYKICDGNNSKYSDGLCRWSDWEIRGQETLLKWEFLGNQLAGMWQLGPPDYMEHFIPISQNPLMNKSLLFRHSTRRNSPEGRSMLRESYLSWFFQRQIRVNEAIGIERTFIGLPYLQAPGVTMGANATPDQKAEFAALQAIGRGLNQDEEACVVLPSDVDPDTKAALYKFQLVNASGSGLADIGNAIRRYDQDIAIALLIGFLLLGMDNVGSRSLGETTADVFMRSINSILESIIGPINRYAIPALLMFNGWDASHSPELTYGKIERSDITSLSQFFAQLVNPVRGAGAGIDMNDPEFIESLAELTDLPLKPRAVPPEVGPAGAPGLNPVPIPPTPASAPAAENPSAETAPVPANPVQASEIDDIEREWNEGLAKLLRA